MLGPSGSGKTTRLMMLAGFEPATYGEIFLNSMPINNVPPHKRGIGMLFQNYALYRHMTVEENLLFPLDVRRMSRYETRQRVANALEVVELPGFHRRLPPSYRVASSNESRCPGALVFEPDQSAYGRAPGCTRQAASRADAVRDQAHPRKPGGDCRLRDPPSERGARLTESFSNSRPPTGPTSTRGTARGTFYRENNTLHGTVTVVRNGKCRVDVDGGEEVSAFAANVEVPDATTTLPRRPERAEIDPASTYGFNTLRGRVEELNYLGGHIRTRLTVAQHDDFIVKVPNTHANRSPKVGEAATIAWFTEDCPTLDSIGGLTIGRGGSSAAPMR